MNDTDCFSWTVELIPSDADVPSECHDFTGSTTEASVQADRFADAANFEVARSVLHRRGPVAPMKLGPLPCQNPGCLNTIVQESEELCRVCGHRIDAD